MYQVWAGSTVRCLPCSVRDLVKKLHFGGLTWLCKEALHHQNDNVIHSATDTHWSNAQSNIDYVDAVLVPYWREQKKKLGLDDDHPVVLIVDTHSAWLEDRFREHLVRVYPNKRGKVRPKRGGESS